LQAASLGPPKHGDLKLLPRALHRHPDNGHGLFLLLNKSLVIDFSWAKIAILSLFGSFNKGISGSGFADNHNGLLYMKISEKEAVSVQSFSEFSSVSLASSHSSSMDLRELDLTLSLSVGVAASAPVAAFIIRNQTGNHYEEQSPW